MAVLPVLQNRPRYQLKYAFCPPSNFYGFCVSHLCQYSVFCKRKAPASWWEGKWKESRHLVPSLALDQVTLCRASPGLSAAWHRQIAVRASSHQLIRNDGIRRSFSLAKWMLGRYVAITLHYRSMLPICWDLVAAVRYGSASENVASPPARWLRLCLMPILVLCSHAVKWMGM